MEFPENGAQGDAVLDELRRMKAQDCDWRGARVFSLVFTAGEDVGSFAEQAHSIYLNENGLSPFAFPSLLRMENEVVAMMADLLGGGAGAAGSMTSGGTESILLAVKTARDHARAHRPRVERADIVIPRSAHPAFQKAAHILDLDVVIAPTSDDSVVDLGALREAVTDRTVMIVGSAPSYPHGIIDPIEEMGRIALEKGVWLHVDSCIGGMVLPFLRRAGHDIPPFGLDVSGVCSISADIHKYGFTPKGASVVLYRSLEMRRRQLFVTTDWPGGIYATPTIAGSRPGGPIAASWAMIRRLGAEGYTRLATEALEASRRLQAGVGAVPGLRVIGRPAATIFAVTSDTLDVYALGERMRSRGWSIDGQHRPASLHMTVMPRHLVVVEPFLRDLEASVAEVASMAPADIGGRAAMYGMVGSLPDRHMAAEMATEYLNDLYRIHESP